MAATIGSQIAHKPNAWWQDDRRNWCAYCGVAIDFASNEPGNVNATRDHVIPKKHGGQVKIPSCKECNDSKKTLDLATFLCSPYLTNRRKKQKNAKSWPLQHLWLAMAMAALQLAMKEDGTP